VPFRFRCTIQRFDNEPLRPYNAGPDALLINLNSLSLTLQADLAQKAVVVLVETPSEDVHIDNHLRLTQDACGDWREKIKVRVNGQQGIELTGSFAATCGDKALNLSPWTANVQVEQLFRALWRENGWHAARQGTRRPDTTTAMPLAIEESPALGEIIRDINKYSNNVMARQVFLTLAAERPATPEGARNASQRGWPRRD